VTLESQIELMTVPQEFCRLCNAVLRASHGDDFLPIDDDQPDAGNDGYLKSERRIFAMHCFKRVQNRSLEPLIRRKMIGDLGKAIALKRAGLWEVEAWTFITNYPVSDSIARDVVLTGEAAGIDVSWRGPTDLAVELERHPVLRERFPALQVNAVSEQLEAINEQVDGIVRSLSPENEPFSGVPKSPEEESWLVATGADFWEYRLFGGVLHQGRDALEFKYLDHAMDIVPRRVEMSFQDANRALSDAFRRVRDIAETINQAFAPTAQERAFGPPGQPGDAVAIRHLAQRVLAVYEELLDAAALIRSVDPPDLQRPIFAIAARYMDEPIEQLRRFIAKAVAEFDALPERAAGLDQPLVITLQLVVSINDATQREFDREARLLRRRIRWLGWIGGDLDARTE
jgi:hypothetical protein